MAEVYKTPSIDRDVHDALARCYRVRVFGNDGSDFVPQVVNADGSTNVNIVGGAFTFTGTLNSTATVNIAGSATLFAVVNAASATVTAFVAGAVTLAAVVNTASPQVTVQIGGTLPAQSVTAFVAGSVTLAAVVNTPSPQVTVQVGGTLPAQNVTAWIAGSVTLFAVPPTTQTIAGTVTSFIAGGVTLNVNQALFPALSATSWIAGSVTLNVNQAIFPALSVTAFVANTVTTNPAQFPSPSLLTTAMANPTTPLVGACRVTFNGSTWQPLQDNYVQVTSNVNGTGAGTIVDMGGSVCLNFTMDLRKTGTVSAYNINLEGSIAGSTYFTLVNATSASGADTTVFAANKPCRYFRYNVASITVSGGTETISLMAARAN